MIRASIDTIHCGMRSNALEIDKFILALRSSILVWVSTCQDSYTKLREHIIGVNGDVKVSYLAVVHHH